MKNKLVSVLMSTHNNANEIKSSIDSILNQTYRNLELLIVDDFSQDNTLEIIKSYKDGRIKYFQNKKNIGLTKSLNFLILQSKGYYIARQDADDISLKNRIESQIEYMDKNQIEVCTTRAKNKQTDKKIPRISFYIPNKILIKFKNPFIHGSLIIKKDLLNKLGNYDENFYFAQDYKLFTEILKKKIRIHTINETLYILNMSNNISTKYKEEQEHFAKCVRKELVPEKFK